MTTEYVLTIAALSALLLTVAWYLLVRTGGPAAPRPLARPLDLGHGPPPVRLTGEPEPAPPGRPDIPWGAVDAIVTPLIVLSGTFVLQVAGVIAITVVARVVSPDTEIKALLDKPAASTAFTAIQWFATVGLPLIYLKARGYSFDRATFGFRRTPALPAIGWWLLVMFLFYLTLPGLYQSLIEYLDPTKLPQQDIVSPFGLTWGGFILALITVTIATPFIEEFFFRGIVHQGLEKRFGFILGAVMSSTIFALFHFDYRLYAPIFMLGFGFALLMHRTRSLWPSIAGHFVVNLIGVLTSYSELFKS